MKLAVIGSRNFSNYDFFKEKLEYLTQNIKEDIVYVSGGAIGTDSLCKRYCQENNYELIEFLPDYKQYSKAATHIRNSQIVEFSDALVAFFNGSSPGTKSTLEKAKKKGITIKIVKI
jgi:predicted Rossmann fold nucleotide-binding protein DprA/Smf involved in DNA uptake